MRMVLSVGRDWRACERKGGSPPPAGMGTEVSEIAAASVSMYPGVGSHKSGVMQRVHMKAGKY